VAVVGAGCAASPDTTLRPDPPPSYAPLRHPFRNATLFRDTDTAAARWQATHGNPSWLDPITATPQAIWLTSPQDLAPVPQVARLARQQQALLVLVAYYIPDRGCTQFKDGAPTPAAYLAWIDRLIDSLDNTHAVIVLEPDAVPADCFTAQRAALLSQATRQLSQAGHFVYIDAGHPRWRSTGETAERLLASGIRAAEGFSINVSNRQTTKDSHQWGRELSDLVGNREFVIDTSRNGLGPPPDDPQRDDE
jgi:endoglucanase